MIAVMGGENQVLFKGTLVNLTLAADTRRGLGHILGGLLLSLLGLGVLGSGLLRGRGGLKQSKKLIVEVKNIYENTKYKTFLPLTNTKKTRI